MIDYIQYFGQRRSGTTWFSRVLKENFITDNVGCGEKWGGKHSPEEFSRGLFDGQVYLPRADNEDGTLFITISRNIYSWLESMSRSPQGYRNTIPPAPVPIFIRRRWVSQNDRIVEGGRFANPIEMRNVKMKAFLDIHNTANNSIIIRYIDFIKSPHVCLEKWADEFDLKFKNGGPVIPALGQTKKIVAAYNDRIKKFQKPDIDFVKARMDAELEREFGHTYEF